MLGAVVVKVDMSDAEAHLANLGQEVLVTDPDGVVFISTRREWRFRTLAPLSDNERQRLRESLRYPGVDFATLPITITTNTGPTQVWTAPRKRRMTHPRMARRSMTDQPNSFAIWRSSSRCRRRAGRCTY